MPLHQVLPGDQANGTPWITRLPFLVQVVDKVEVIDTSAKPNWSPPINTTTGILTGGSASSAGLRGSISLTRRPLRTSRSGLHGDGGLHQQRRPIMFHRWRPDRGFTLASIFDEIRRRPLITESRPTGVAPRVYRGDNEAVPLDDTIVEELRQTPREAYRALGAVLRPEVYAHDGSAKSRVRHPYLVTESRTSPGPRKYSLRR